MEREPSADPGIIRIACFRVPEDQPALYKELRALPPWGRSRWIGRRMMDDPGGPEIAVVSTWDSLDDMERNATAGRDLFAPGLAAAASSTAVERYSCRAWGSWPRSEKPLLLRIFRGQLVEGSAEAFDAETMSRYLANFERNPRCAAILAGIDESGIVVLATLWTTWDAIVTATGGDIRQSLPVTLPGWMLGGSAVHYELVVAETEWRSAVAAGDPAGG